MRYVLGLDLGTSSLKAVLLGEDGAAAAGATRGYGMQSPRPGWAEQAPEHWWTAACEATREVLARADITADCVACVAAGGQMHGTVLLDAAHQPLRAAIIWPDTRAAAEAAAAEAALAARDLLPALGGGVSPGFMLATLPWLRAHEPETWRRAAHALLPKDYVRYRLTGAVASDASDGSGVPAIDLATGGWSAAALAALDLPIALLPELVPSGALAGAVTEQARAQCGLRAGTPVLCGGSDQAMAALGAGLTRPGTLLVSISTGGQLVTPLDAPLPAPERGARTLCHAMPGAYLALSATLGAGLSLRWLRESVFGDREGGDGHVLAEAARAPAGAGGLLFLPYLAGERAPLLDPGASGAFVGMLLAHGRPHLARAVLEGIACSLRHALEPLLAAGVEPRRIILAGGLARDPLMRAILAGVLGQPLLPLAVAEQSALGAALLAAVHAGFYSTIDDACAAVVRYEAPVEPEPGDVALYAQVYARYLALYPALRASMHELRGLSRA